MDAPASPASSSPLAYPLPLSSYLCRLPFTLASDSFRAWWIGSSPPLAHRRRLFLHLCTPLVLRCLQVIQLLIHLSFLFTAVALLARRSAISSLLPADAEADAAWRILEALPAWLLARSVVGVVLSVRRLWLGDKWTSSTWEAAWCVLVVWASTGVVAGTSLVALGGLPGLPSAIGYVLWALVSVLLLLLAAHVSFFSMMLLFFPMPALTVNMPVVPVGRQWDDSPAAKPAKPQGLTPQQLRALPSSVCRERRDDACCAVCMDDVEVGQRQRELRCGHCYHQACIDRWLSKKRSCPLCVSAVRVAGQPASLSEWAVELSQLAKAPRRVAAPAEAEQSVAERAV